MVHYYRFLLFLLLALWRSNSSFIRCISSKRCINLDFFTGLFFAFIVAKRIFSRILFSSVILRITHICIMVIHIDKK